MAQYHHDNQVRRFLLQFSKIFSDWYVTRSVDNDGNATYMRVPVMYGDMSRSAAAALNNNSASTPMSAPMISYYVSGLEYDQKRTQAPSYVDKMQVRQRRYNTSTKALETIQGQAFTVERMMPVPYTLRVTVDIVTSNQQQKFELFEQLGVLFNPGLEIQSTDNYIDWTSLSTVFQESINWTNRSVPAGTNNAMDILTWKFYMPIWLSAPAKVKKFGAVEKIIASIFEGKNVTDIMDDELIMGTRSKFSPFGYKILYVGDSLQLLPAKQAMNDQGNLDTRLYWTAFLNQYGAVRPGISQIRLQNPYMNTDIVGTINFNPVDDRLLVFSVDKDTLPANTQMAVDSVIEPTKKFPETGLPSVAPNQRYLILGEIGPDMEAWGGLSAKPNDIIEYDGSKWVVVFESALHGGVDYVTNLTTGIQYRHTDHVWQKSVEGFYDEGSFDIVI